MNVRSAASGFVTASSVCSAPEVLCSWGCYLRHVVVHAGIRRACTSPAAVIEPRSTGELAGGKADLPRIECRA